MGIGKGGGNQQVTWSAPADSYWQGNPYTAATQGVVHGWPNWNQEQPRYTPYEPVPTYGGFFGDTYNQMQTPFPSYYTRYPMPNYSQAWSPDPVQLEVQDSGLIEDWHEYPRQQGADNPENDPTVNNDTTNPPVTSGGTGSGDFPPGVDPITGEPYPETGGTGGTGGTGAGGDSSTNAGSGGAPGGGGPPASQDTTQETTQDTPIETADPWDPYPVMMDYGERIETLENAPGFDGSTLQDQITANQEAIMGFSPYDDSSLQEQVTANQEAIMGYAPYDDSSLQQQIAANQQAIAGYSPYDDSGLMSRMEALEGQQSPAYDPGPMMARLEALENQERFTPFDPSSLIQRIAQLEARPQYDPQPDFNQFMTRYDDRLAGLENRPYYGAPDLSNYVTYDNLPTYNQPDMSNYVTYDNLPVYNQPDMSQYMLREEMPAFSVLNQPPSAFGGGRYY